MENIKINASTTEIISLLARDIPLSKWADIIKIKEDYILTGQEDGLKNVPEIIGKSWRDARLNRTAYHQEPFGYEVPKEELNNIMQKHAQAAAIAEEYLVTPRALHLQYFTNYYLTLLTPEGVMIFAGGSSIIKDYFQKINVKPGVSFAENIVGTTAHSLAAKYAKPIQLIGPYNYVSLFNNCVLTAVPVFNSKREVIAIYEVFQFDLPEYAINFTVNIFGMALSTANLISMKIDLEEERNRLNVMKSFLNVLPPPKKHYEGGLITIDKKDIIVYIEKEAADIIHYDDSKKNLSEYIKNYREISKALLKKQTIKNLKINLCGQNGDETSFYIDIHPVKDLSQNEILGATLQINKKDHSEKRPTGLRYTFDSIIGKHPSIKKVKQIAKNIAKTNNNVLILGESGTGKEIFAQAIHNESLATGPFVAINCASIPKTLIETELFGYVGGTFTDAKKEGRQGKIEFADNGTLFLDEIGDMPLELQPVLLRVLEEKVVMRIGGKEDINVNFRVIAATNTDLYQKVLKKEFREDLYFRLAVITLEIPPLRERGNDINLLANHFLKKTCGNNGLKDIKISKKASEILLKYSWHGNIRQLENAIVAAVCSLNNGEEIEVNHLPKIILKDTQKKTINSIMETETELIKNAIKASGGNIKEAAKILGISRATIYRKIKEKEIQYQ